MKKIKNKFEMKYLVFDTECVMVKTCILLNILLNIHILLITINNTNKLISRTNIFCFRFQDLFVFVHIFFSKVNLNLNTSPILHTLSKKFKIFIQFADGSFYVIAPRALTPTGNSLFSLGIQRSYKYDAPIFPFPSFEENQMPNGIISASSVAYDKCGRLWILDNVVDLYD